MQPGNKAPPSTPTVITPSGDLRRDQFVRGWRFTPTMTLYILPLPHGRHVHITSVMSELVAKCSYTWVKLSGNLGRGCCRQEVPTCKLCSFWVSSPYLTFRQHLPSHTWHIQFLLYPTPRAWGRKQTPWYCFRDMYTCVYTIDAEHGMLGTWRESKVLRQQCLQCYVSNVYNAT